MCYPAIEHHPQSGFSQDLARFENVDGSNLLIRFKFMGRETHAASFRGQQLNDASAHFAG